MLSAKCSKALREPLHWFRKIRLLQDLYHVVDLRDLGLNGVHILLEVRADLDERKKQHGFTNVWNMREVRLRAHQLGHLLSPLQVQSLERGPCVFRLPFTTLLLSAITPAWPRGYPELAGRGTGRSVSCWARCVSRRRKVVVVSSSRKYSNRQLSYFQGLARALRD